MSNSTAPTGFRLQPDGWYDGLPMVNAHPKKTKNAILYQCPKCGAVIQIKTKVWLRSTRAANVSIQTLPQCDTDRVVMQQIEV